MMWPNKIIEKTILSKKKKVVQALREERGAIFVLTALMLPVIFGFMGIAYDVGNVYVHKSRLQNVADAAALAGARAYLDSQNKTEGPKDSVDTSTSTDKSTTYEVGGGSKNRGVPHADADTAADEYIYKNMRNLGNKVGADRYSHYALNSAGDNPKTFYRIGLYEDVPLYFLPVVLKNKTKQTVRAGAVALVEPGTPKVIPGSGGTPSTSSLFDDLFVVNSKLTVSRGIVSNPDYNALASGLSKIVTTFDGDMVFTGGTWSYSGSYEVQDNHEGLYLYTKEEKEYQIRHGLSILQMNSIVNVGGRLVQDTSIAMDSYVAGFLKKLTRPHMEVKVQNYEFNTSNLTSIANEFAKDTYAVNTTSGTVYFQSSSGNDYYYCSTVYQNISGNDYMVLHWEDTGIQNAATNWQYLPVKGYVYDANNNKILVYKTGDNNFRFFKRAVVNWNTVDTEIHPTIVSTDNKENKYSYSDNGSSVAFSISKVHADFSHYSKVSDTDIKSSSVYHWTSGSGMNTTLNVNGGLDGNESDPIYIIVSEGNPKIIVKNSNQRPIIYCYLGSSSEVEFYINSNVTFKGTIYVPYKGVMIKNGSGAQFEGNIIANYINIQEAGSGYTQKNFIANDNDLSVASDAIAAAQEARKVQATTFAKNYLSSLGVTDATWSNPAWFASLTEENQGKIQKAWYNARLQLWKQYGIDMPDWPWNTGGKTTNLSSHHYSTSTTTGGSTEDQIVIEGESLRLINYRTEYTENDSIVNPFRALSLEKPYSY